MPRPAFAKCFIILHDGEGPLGPEYAVGAPHTLDGPEKCAAEAVRRHVEKVDIGKHGCSWSDCEGSSYPVEVQGFPGGPHRFRSRVRIEPVFEVEPLVPF